MKNKIINLCERCEVKCAEDYDGRIIQRLTSPFKCEICGKVVKTGATWRVWLREPE